MLTVEECMDALIEGLAAETFIILPQPAVAEMWADRGADYDAWITQAGVTFGNG